VSDDEVFGGGNKLPSACLTVMILFAMTGMAIFLVSVRPTLWARLSDNHGFC
jgi:hypothetical protein